MRASISRGRRRVTITLSLLLGVIAPPTAAGWLFSKRPAATQLTGPAPKPCMIAAP